MAKALKITLALILALAAWFVAATLGNFILRAVIPNYRAEEATMAFSLVAQIGRLVLGLISTAASSLVALVIVRGSVAVALSAGCILFVLFVPVHVDLWAKFPIWYHLFFLASLPLGALAFGRFIASRQHHVV